MIFLKKFLRLHKRSFIRVYKSFMTRTEIRDDLKKRGLFDKTGNRDPVWQEAFKVYFNETKRKLSPSCGSCYNTLRNWMNQ